MKKWLMAVLFGTALVLGACGGGDDEAGDDNATEEDGGGDDQAAEDIFEENCASCHGEDLSGQSGPNLQEVGAEYDEDEIADIIEEGKEGDEGQMPGGLISGDDLDTVASWLADKE